MSKRPRIEHEQCNWGVKTCTEYPKYAYFTIPKSRQSPLAKGTFDHFLVLKLVFSETQKGPKASKTGHEAPKMGRKCLFTTQRIQDHVWQFPTILGPNIGHFRPKVNHFCGSNGPPKERYGFGVHKTVITGHGRPDLGQRTLACTGHTTLRWPKTARSWS